MEIRQIESFLSLAATLHFGRSSQELHLSQPALSLQIKALEEELGVKLFDRNRQRTLLTEAGALFREDAAAAMERLAEAKKRAALTARGKLGVIRVGFISTAGYEIVPYLVRRYRKENPNVEFSLRNVLTEDQIKLLSEGTLDVGFLRIPMEALPHLELTPIHREPFVVAVPAAHPLARVKHLRLRQLAGQPFVMYERRFAAGYYDQIAAILTRAGIVPEVVQTAGEMPTLVSLVDSGLGIALLPRSALTRKPDSVKVCMILDRIPPSQIALASARHIHSMTVRQFVAFAKRDLATEMIGQESMNR
jgi:DNA-binding transcriptional LysR family regulator